MDDLISRQEAIKVASGYCHPANIADELRKLPSAGPELDEWCYDCKEYDKEKHSCPRWNRVIRNALKDAQSEIIYCKNCKFTDGKKPIADGRYWCVLHESFMYFCSDAERGQ